MLDDPGSLPSLHQQLERRLEVVHLRPHRPVNVDPGPSRQPAEVAVMPHKAAPHSPFVLLGSGPDVLAVGPGTGELDFSFRAPRYQPLVDEGIVVVRVDSPYRKRYLPSNGFQTLDRRGLFAGRKWKGLRSNRADVGGHQAVAQGANQGAAAVGYHVDFQKDRRRAVPSAVNTNWNFASHGLPPSTPPARARGLPEEFSNRSRMEALAENRRWRTSWSSFRFRWYSMDSTKWGRAF